MYCAEHCCTRDCGAESLALGSIHVGHGPASQSVQTPHPTPMVLAIKACGHDFLPRLSALGECCRPAAVSHSAGDLTTAAVSKLHQTSHLA